MAVCTGVGFGWGLGGGGVGGAVTCRETSATDDEMQRARRVRLKETGLGACVWCPRKKHLSTTNPFYPYFYIHTFIFIYI